MMNGRFATPVPGERRSRLRFSDGVRGGGGQTSRCSMGWSSLGCAGRRERPPSVSQRAAERRRAASAAGVAPCASTRSRNALPALKCTACVASLSTGAPVRGFLLSPPRRGCAEKAPKPQLSGRLREEAIYYGKRRDAWNGAQICVDLGSSGGFAVVANQMRRCASRVGRSFWAAGDAAGERALRRHKPQFGAQNRVPGDRTGR